jgi:ABC-type Zn uptake system ZnuABC Zn-binding protein ZnuA
MLTLILTGTGCKNGKPASSNQTKLSVVTTSTDIADIVEDVGGDKVAVVNIIPPGQCPGHFDLKTNSLQMLEKASLFFMHDYDNEMFTDKLIKSVGNTKLQKVVIQNEQQTLMLPTRRLEGIAQVTTALTKADSGNASAYQAAAAELSDKTTQIAEQQKERLNKAGAGQLKVLVAGYQLEFAKWAELKVIGVFPPDISANKTKELIDLGQKEGASLVIDNLQTPNKTAAVGITKELDVPEISVSNFPGGLDGTDKWADSFTKNVDLLLAHC